MARPGWPFLAISSLFIGLCLFVLGFCFSCSLHWDPCAWVAALSYGGPALGAAYWQYRATFKAHAPTARILSRVLTFLGTVFVLPFVAVVLWQGIYQLAWFFALLSVVFIVPGMFNLAWFRQLTTATEGDKQGVSEPPARNTKFRFSLTQTFAGIACLTALLAGFSYGVRDIPPQIAMHVSPPEAGLDLPPGASDVCIYRGYRGRMMYNFAIAEPGFWTWAKPIVDRLSTSSGPAAVSPVVGSFTIYTYSSVTDQFEHHTINSGWCYEWHSPKGGIYFAYDSTQGRAYYVQ